jgi:hypothetical protein
VPVLLEQRQIHLRLTRPDPILSLPTMSHSAASEAKHRPFLLGHPGEEGHVCRQFLAVADCVRNFGQVEVHSPELRGQVSGGEYLENYKVRQ